MNLSTDKQREMLRQMLTIRCFEERASADYHAGKIYGVVHCYIGEEAVAVGVCAALDVKGGKIQSARIGLTGAGTHATRLTKVEQALAGQAASKEAVEKAAKDAGAEMTDLNADIHASADYRKAMIGVFVKRALTKALARVA